MTPAVNLRAISHILTLTQDPHPTPDYQVCRSPADVHKYVTDGPCYLCVEHPGTAANSEDTETKPNGDPYCLTFCLRPGTGRLIYRHDEPTLSYYRQLMEHRRINGEPAWAHIFHNWLHDSNEYDATIKLSAFNLPFTPFTDTMVRAYNLCLGGGADEGEESRAGRGSLGLKQLAYRHLHMKMTSFKDTVYPHSSLKLLPWLETVRDTYVLPEPPSVCVCGCASYLHALNKASKPSGKCSGCGECKRHKKGKPEEDPNKRQYGYLVRKAKNLIEAITRNQLPDKYEDLSPDPFNPDEDDEPYKFVDPWKRIQKWHPHDHGFLRDKGLNVYPRASIEDVPEPELLVYACRDADATLRLYLYLQTLQPWVFYR